MIVLSDVLFSRITLDSVCEEVYIERPNPLLP